MVLVRSAQEFLDTLIGQFYARMHHSPANNYDHRRFSFDGVDRGHDFDLNQHRDFFLFVLREQAALYDTFTHLEDPRSKSLFIEILLYRLLGHLHTKLPANNEDYWLAFDTMTRIPRTASSLSCDGMFGPLSHFEDVSFDGYPLSLDCLDLDILSTFLLKQYHFDNGLVRIQPEEGDYVIDGGACFGDTGLTFATRIGASGRVFLFELLQTHIDVIRHNVAQNPSLAPRVAVFECGLSDASNQVAEGGITTSGGYAPGFSIGPHAPQSVALRSIDDLVSQGAIPRVHYIKMDIEGFELRALQGARRTLQTYRPRLAISIYHSPSDFITIPAFLKGLGLGYRLYLDHHTIHSEETVLYAVTE
jgi:FkbM family methyltransferase